MRIWGWVGGSLEPLALEARQKLSDGNLSGGCCTQVLDFTCMSHRDADTSVLGFI